MNENQMLQKMCEAELSQADIKAICKARDLPPACLKSRELFRHHFLGENGIERAIASLDEKQILCLHLLNAEGEGKGIEFLSRLYEEAHRGRYRHTFNDKYNAVFKSVKTELVRKGLLLYAEARKDPWEKTTVLERQRFMFPSNFSPFLPLPENPVIAQGPNYQTLRKDVFRDKLAEILRSRKAPDSQPGEDGGRLHIKNRRLLLGKAPFTLGRLERWNKWKWADSVKVEPGRNDSTLHPVHLVIYYLSLLEEGHWSAPDGILPLWKIAYPDAEKLPDAPSTYEEGWQRGCLDKIVKDRRAYYRLQETDPDRGNAKPDDFLLTADDESIGIDPSHAPLDTLEWLCDMCNVSVLQGKLTAKPDLVRVSHAAETVTKDPAFDWLQKNHKAFRRVFRTIEKRKGKTVVHNNLMIARIGDLSLKVQLEKEFASTKQVVSLSDEYISFPVGLLPKIRKVVAKSGNAVKSVGPNENS